MTAADRECAELLARHEGLIGWTARKIWWRLPFTAEFDELLAAGRRAMWDAWRRFDPARGMKFTTYAVMLMRTEMAREAFWFHNHRPERGSGRKPRGPERLPEFCDVRAAYDVHGAELETDRLTFWMLERGAFRALTRAEHSVIILSFWYGWAPSEIARLTGRSPGAVRDLRRRGLRRLRAALAAAPAAA